MHSSRAYWAAAAAASAAVAAAVFARSAMARRRHRVRCDLLVKLGGSAITEKAKFETLAAAPLDAAARAIARGGQRAVLMHGAGSFGHFQAREYAISKGATDGRTISWRGFAATRASVTRLNRLVVDALVGAGVAAVGVSPFPQWRTVAAAPAHTHLASDLADLLAVGLVPVLHGDAVLDSSQGCAILSGDWIMEALARELRPRLVVFVTDVPGVYTRPPTEPGATLIEHITVDSAARITSMGTAGGGDGGNRGGDGDASGPSMTSAAHDVTGGIATKLGAAARIAASGMVVVIVEANTEHAEAALSGKLPHVCTVMERE
jgi:isopentenyl phosphate kinase